MKFSEPSRDLVVESVHRSAGAAMPVAHPVGRNERPAPVALAKSAAVIGIHRNKGQAGVFGNDVVHAGGHQLDNFRVWGAQLVAAECSPLSLLTPAIVEGIIFWVVVKIPLRRNQLTPSMITAPVADSHFLPLHFHGGVGAVLQPPVTAPHPANGNGRDLGDVQIIRNGNPFLWWNDFAVVNRQYPGTALVLFQKRIDAIQRAQIIATDDHQTVGNQLESESVWTFIHTFAGRNQEFCFFCFTYIKRKILVAATLVNNWNRRVGYQTDVFCQFFGCKYFYSWSLFG